MRISIIIPTYNRPGRLAQELACLAEQDGDFIEEVLICDDGSTADVAGAVAPFAGRFRRLELLRQRDRGFRAGAARNMGIATAQGDVLLFLDDDLLLPADFVSRHAAAHSAGVNGTPSRRVVLGFRYRTSDRPEGVHPAPEAFFGSDDDDRVEHIGPRGEGIALHPTPWFFVYSCNLSVTHLPEQVLFDTDFVGWGMEDTELGYRLVKAGFHVLMEPTARVLHVEAASPRDPFRCEERGLAPCYDSYVINMVQLIDKYPADRQLKELLSSELRWYVRDAETGRWVKNGLENDAEAVIAAVRSQRREARGGTAGDEAKPPRQTAS